LCGIVGVLVDTDHIIAYLIPQWQYHQWFPAPQLHPWVEPFALRAFHPQIFLVSSIIIFCMVSYLAGLYIKLVLKRRN